MPLHFVRKLIGHEVNSMEQKKSHDDCLNGDTEIRANITSTWTQHTVLSYSKKKYSQYFYCRFEVVLFFQSPKITHFSIKNYFFRLDYTQTALFYRTSVSKKKTYLSFHNSEPSIWCVHKSIFRFRFFTWGFFFFYCIHISRNAHFSPQFSYLNYWILSVFSHLFHLY